jgi:RHS repeat-associated protein
VKRNLTTFIYAGGKVIAEYANGAAASSPSVEYVNLGGGQLATIAGGVTTFNYADHLSTRVTANMSGSPVRTYGHFPAGETLYQTGAPSDFQFTSYRRDANSGLDYADARFYSSRLGRFLSPDPILGGGYAYADSDPINLVDPSGQDGGMPCSLDPFQNFALPLCGPDQIGGGVGFGGNCGFNFGDNLSFDFTFTSNCKSFTINFNNSNASGPFGSYKDSLLNLLRIIVPIDTCPAGTFECPDDGAPLFGQPECDPRWCAMDAQSVSAGDPNYANDACLHQANLAALNAAIPFHIAEYTGSYYYHNYNHAAVDDQTPVNKVARRTGGAMSNAGRVSKWTGFLKDTGKALGEIGKIVTFVAVMDRREQAYQNCRNWYADSHGNFYFHTADGKPGDSRPHF